MLHLLLLDVWYCSFMYSLLNPWFPVVTNKYFICIALESIYLSIDITIYRFNDTPPATPTKQFICITFLPHLTTPPAQLSCRGCRHVLPPQHMVLLACFLLLGGVFFFFFFPRMHSAPPRTYQQKPLITTKRFHTCNLQTSNRWRRSIGPHREINLRQNVVENSTCRPPVYLIVMAPLHLDMPGNHARKPG